MDFGHLSFANTEALNGRGKTSEEQDSEDMEGNCFINLLVWKSMSEN